ncbi:MAG: PSD1 and planctomycete cytochrome C domain-containing protein [Planctomycetota bacterium]
MSRSPSNLLAAVAVLTLYCGSAGAWQDSARPVDPAATEFFERSVRPLFQQYCVECHSSENAAENGELDLESLPGIAVGGSRGPLTAAQPNAPSLLMLAVNYTDVDLQMPPTGKLPAAQIATLQQWIGAGAPLPEYSAAPRPATAAIDFHAGRKFWSLLPLKSAAVPSQIWPGQTASPAPIDAFILHQLQQHNLTPSPPAPPETLLRRLTFDLTGLPPTPAQQVAFAADSSPQAVERLVDELLASPHYGERWARVWLDLARYTDFTPDWQNPTDRGWIYRDWVVDAFNRNLPFNEFLRLQLAADRIPETPPADLAALGFLGLSPTYWKELRLAPVVIEQIVADEWDERVDAVCRTFLGLTVSCARCHDHKFDPISTADYYGLAGVFASTQLEERPLLPADQAVAVITARSTAKSLEAKLKSTKDKDPAAAASLEQQLSDLRQKTPGFDAPFAHVLKESSLFVLPEGDELTKLEYRDGTARDLPIFRRGNPGNTGELVPRRFLTVFSADQPRALNAGSGRLQLADALLHEAAPLVARVIVNRIWDQHFGTGLVRTTSDFGAQGERPSHPELLEYLAARFVEQGWDIKWLHREIVLSQTWRQSSTHRVKPSDIDPDNRLLWKGPRRRLDWEMWRDAALAASGVLDLKIGGPGQAVDDPAHVRRSLYTIIAREELHPVLRMHDFPEASAHSPRREPTTTPLQQLFLLNSAWTEQRAAELVRRLQSVNGAERVQQAWQLLFARSADQLELAAGLEFMTRRQATGASPESAWQDYFEALLSINEFHFAD